MAKLNLRKRFSFQVYDFLTWTAVKFARFVLLVTKEVLST